MNNLSRCERCNKETNTFTGSYFNTEMICLECDSLERKHPEYEKAKKLEYEQVLKGNYNYEGIGLPSDYNSFVELMSR